MADWFSHPSYVRLRDQLVARLVRPTYRFTNLRQVVFLCGAGNSTPRDNLADYLRRHGKTKLVFYADDVWTAIAKNADQDALQMEARLAQLADAVIVIVESPGTYAELGAFSLSPELRAKLLPIIDSRYERANSFINTGPVRWVNSESRLGRTIYTRLATILEAGPEILRRLEAVRRQPREAVERQHLLDRHILFFLADLVAVVGPVSTAQCTFYVQRTLGAQLPENDIASLLALGVAMGVLARIAIDGTPLFFRPLHQDQLRPFQHDRMFDLAAERAKFLSVLQVIPSARAALDMVARR